MTVASAVNHLTKFGAITYADNRFSVQIGRNQVIVSAYMPSDPKCPISGVRVVPAGSVTGINCEHLTRAIKFATATAN